MHTSLCEVTWGKMVYLQSRWLFKSLDSLVTLLQKIPMFLNRTKRNSTQVSLFPDKAKCLSFQGPCLFLQTVKACSAVNGGQPHSANVENGGGVTAHQMFGKYTKISHIPANIQSSETKFSYTIDLLLRSPPDFSFCVHMLSQESSCT